VLGTTTHGAIRRGEFSVEHTGFGQTFFGTEDTLRHRALGVSDVTVAPVFESTAR
jgi:ketopantoate reductase